MVLSGNDGILHYVAGQNLFIVIPGDTTFQDFYGKMEDLYGGPVRICYQLPRQNLDALVSVYTGEDFEYMMDEFDSLSKDSNHGSTELRVFLFPSFDLERLSASLNNAASNATDNEAPTFDEDTNERNSTLNSNVRGEVFINDAMENMNFQVPSNVVGTRNVATQTEEDIEGRHFHQQQQDDSSSLFSDQDPWLILGFQLSNKQGDQTHNN